MNVINGGRVLQINRNNSLPLNFVIGAKESLLSELLSAYLTPTAGGSAKIDDSLNSVKYMEYLLNLDEFIGRPGSVALFFGLPIINVLN